MININYLDIITNTKKFFKSVKKETIGITVLKTFPLLLILILIQQFIQKDQYQEIFSQIGIDSTLFYIILVIYMIIIMAISIFLSPLFIKWALKILNVKSSYAQILKVILYSGILSYMLLFLAFIPYYTIPSEIIGSLVMILIAIALGIYVFILECKGISEYCNITVGKAAGAFLLTFALMLGIVLAIFIVLVIIALIIGLIIGG